jgi:hypothetical protein
VAAAVALAADFDAEVVAAVLLTDDESAAHPVTPNAVAAAAIAIPCFNAVSPFTGVRRPSPLPIDPCGGEIRRELALPAPPCFQCVTESPQHEGICWAQTAPAG